MSLLRKAILVNGAEFICLALSVVQAAILARALGPAGVGQYDLVRSVLVLTPQLCCLGFPLSFLYHSRRNTENTKKYLMNTIWLMLLLSMAGGAGLVFLVVSKAEYFGFIPWFAMIGIGLYVPTLLGNVIARNILLIEIEARKLSLMRILSVGSGVVITLTLWSTGILRVPQALLCFVFTAFVGMAVGWTWTRDYIDLSIKPSLCISRKLAFMGIRLSWADLMVLFNAQVNILIIKYLLEDFQSVGYFSRAQRIAALVVLSGRAIMPMLFSRWASLPQDRLTAHLEKVLRFGTSVSMIIFLAILVFGKWLILIVYGKEFLPALQSLRILVPGAAVYLLSKTLMFLLSSRGVPELSALVLFVGTISNIALSFLLIPQMGISGAAWASTGGSIVLLLLLTLIVRKKYDIKVMHCLYLNKSDIKSLWKSLLS